MSFRSRMDSAYGRRGGALSEFPVQPRPVLGENVLRDPDGTVLPVVVLEQLGQRRCRVRFRNGAEMVVADSLLRALA